MNANMPLLVELRHRQIRVSGITDRADDARVDAGQAVSNQKAREECPRGAPR
jgi:hypothetical protein